MRHGSSARRDGVATLGYTQGTREKSYRRLAVSRWDTRSSYSTTARSMVTNHKVNHFTWTLRHHRACLKYKVLSN